MRLPCGNISRIIIYQKPKQEALYDIRPLTLRIHVLLDYEWCRSYQIDRIFSHFSPYQNNHTTLSSIKVDMSIRDVVCIEDCKLRRAKVTCKGVIFRAFSHFRALSSPFFPGLLLLSDRHFESLEVPMTFCFYGCITGST